MQLKNFHAAASFAHQRSLMTAWNKETEWINIKKKTKKHGLD